MTYYILREDGTSIFLLPYNLDFCIHCLFLLQEDGHHYTLLLSLFAFITKLHIPALPSPGRIAGGEKANPTVY